MNTKRDLIEQEVYNDMCSSCRKAKYCHEECVTCEEYDNAVAYRLTLKDVVLKDFHERDVHVGDKVTLLKKVYGFCGIDRAYLIDVTYKGKGRWGYEFDYESPRIPKYFTCFRVKEPQCILFKKKGGK